MVFGAQALYSGSKHFLKRLVSQKLIYLWWDFAPKTTDFPKNTWLIFALQNFLLSQNPDKQRTFDIHPQSPKSINQKVLCQRATPIILIWGKTFILTLFLCVLSSRSLVIVYLLFPPSPFLVTGAIITTVLFQWLLGKSLIIKVFAFLFSLLQGLQYQTKRHNKQKETSQCDRCYHYARSLILYFLDG